MSAELTGKVAVVTGAGSGIGRAIADRLAHAGAAVAINYFGHEDGALELEKQLNTLRAEPVALAVEADVSDRASVARLMDAAVERFGRLDVLVNNAGVESSAPLLDLDETTWNRVLSINLTGPFLCLQAAARRMPSEGGSVVNISSIHEDYPFPEHTAYAAAKGGLRMLMRNAALELAEQSIRVNNVAPGAIATPINQATLDDPEKVERLSRLVPMQRMGTPEEVAEVALFLASTSSAYVTGSTYYVDGGMVRRAEAL